MSTSDTTVSRRTVFYKGVRIGTIVGSRTFWRGAVTPQSGFDVWVDGTRNPLGNAGRLPYAYFAEIATALKAGAYDAQFEAARLIAQWAAERASERASLERAAKTAFR